MQRTAEALDSKGTKIAEKTSHACQRKSGGLLGDLREALSELCGKGSQHRRPVALCRKTPRSI